MQAIFTDEQIKDAYEVDAKLIESAFKINEKLGEISILSSLNGFTDFLICRKGKYIPSMDMDYRRYLVGLLDTLMKTIENEEHKAIVFSVIVFSAIVFPKSESPTT